MLLGESSIITIDKYKTIKKPMVAVLLCSAKANLALKQLHSAMWDAKQALVKAAADNEAGGQAAALKIIAEINKVSDRPVKVGRDLRN